MSGRQVHTLCKHANHEVDKREVQTNVTDSSLTWTDRQCHLHVTLRLSCVTCHRITTAIHCNRIKLIQLSHSTDCHHIKTYLLSTTSIPTTLTNIFISRDTHHQEFRSGGWGRVGTLQDSHSLKNSRREVCRGAEWDNVWQTLLHLSLTEVTARFSHFISQSIAPVNNPGSPTEKTFAVKIFFIFFSSQYPDPETPKLMLIHCPSP